MDNLIVSTANSRAGDLAFMMAKPTSQGDFVLEAFMGIAIAALSVIAIGGAVVFVRNLRTNVWFSILGLVFAVLGGVNVALAFKVLRLTDNVTWWHVVCAPLALGALIVISLLGCRRERALEAMQECPAES